LKHHFVSRKCFSFSESAQEEKMENEANETNETNEKEIF
jgi:hypothetical protein